MPVRFPRPVMALIATGTAAVTVAVAGMPAAHADQVRHKEWWLGSLGVTAAWTASQGSGVTVAVLSDGVQASQADLAGAIKAAPAPAGLQQASGQYFGETGTGIASLIAGRGHGSGSASGILGVAPAAKILSIPVTLPADDPELSRSSVAAAIPNAIAAGIKYAVNHGATVIDLPIDPGQPGSSGTPGASAAVGGSAAEQQAVSYALAHGVVLVAPAGDDGSAADAPNYPAAYSGVISVGAFNSTFTKAPWSSHRSYVTVTAAGEGVLAAANSGGYRTFNSTSAASAVVAGIAALIRARYPSLTVDEVRSAITTSTVYRRTDGRTDGSGYGTVNADRAMAAAAVLGMPKGSRAGTGAEPLQTPAAIPAVSATQGIGSQLIRAGEISAGLFAVLLLLIIAYAATGRRRRPATTPALAAQWTHRQGQSRYPHAAAADADRMLEVFTTPVSEPGRAGFASGADFGGAGLSTRGSQADDGLFAPAAGRLAGSVAGGPPMTAGPATESGGLQSHGPATRAVSKRPAVSGTPPWEPASAPHTELPWTATTGRHSIGNTPAPEALPAGETYRHDPEPRRDEPFEQPLFRMAGQQQPHPVENPAPAAWDSPVASPGPTYGLPDQNAPLRGGAGWDGTRWNPAPATGPVIEGSVLSSKPADQGRPFSAGYSSQPSQADQYGQPAQYSQPGQYNQRDLGSQPDWRQRQTWNESQPSGSQYAPAGGIAPQPGPDWQAPDWQAPDWQAPEWQAPDPPAQPRVTPAGLPVRTPRPSTPPPGHLSPSGSLWERAASEPSGYEGTSGYQDAVQDSGDRPIYGWDPSARRSARGYPPPTELSE